MTAMLNGKAFSYTTEFHEGAFRRIEDVPGFQRGLDFPGEGPVLDVCLVSQEKSPPLIYALVKTPGGWFKRDKVRVVT